MRQRAPAPQIPRDERQATAVFLTPALLVTFGVILIPLLEALWVSFHRYTLTMPGRPWIGLANYAGALTDPTFWAALGRTLYFTLISTGLELVLGMLIALLLNEKFVGRGLLRGILLIPWALPTIVNGMMWRWIDNADYGALNALLTQLHLLDKYHAWLSSPWTAMNMVIVADVWKMTPLVALLLLANLSTIPDELYEAASIDGAGAFGRFWNVTVPSIRAGILVSLVLRTIEAFKVFDIIFIMTRSGPANGTQTIAYYAYTEAFTSLQFGKGAALSYLIGIFIVALALIYFRLIREEAAA
jgi:multiple sugar transport system permease protein/N,N'-diacetylchitobiose transport system permease protein